MLAVSVFLLALLFLVAIYHIDFLDNTDAFPSPGFVAVLVYFLYYNVPAFVFLLMPSILNNYIFYHGYSVEIYHEVSLVGIACILFTYVGYYVGKKILRSSRFKIIDRLDLSISKHPVRNLENVAIVTILIGFGASLLKLKLGWTHYGGVLAVYERSTPLNQLISIFEHIGVFGYILLIYLSFNQSKTNFKRLFMFSACLAYFLHSLFSGGSRNPIVSAIIIILYLVYKKEYFRKGYVYIKTIACLFCAYIFFIIVFYFKQLVRQLYEYGYQASSWGVIDAIMSKDAFRLKDLDIYQAISSMLNTLMGATSFAVIMSSDYVKPPYDGFWSWFKMIPLGLVPRFIYQEKGDIALGMWFTDHYWRNLADAMRAGFGTQGTALFIPGDFAINFGVLSVIPGMLFVGFIISIFSVKIGKNGGASPVSFLFLSGLYFVAVHHIYSFASYVVGSIREFFVILMYTIIVNQVLNFISGKK